MFDKKAKRGPKGKLMSDLRNAHFKFGTEKGIPPPLTPPLKNKQQLITILRTRMHLNNGTQKIWPKTSQASPTRARRTWRLATM